MDFWRTPILAVVYFSSCILNIEHGKWSKSKIRRVPSTTAKMAPAVRPTRVQVSAPEAATGAVNVYSQEDSAGGTTPAVGAGAGPGRTPPAPTTVTVYIMDTVVPTIPDVTADDIERKMPYPTLTKCKDAPTYSTMSTIREEMFCNFIAVKSTFGGGKARSLRLPPEAYDLTHQDGRAFDGPEDRRRLPDLRG